MGMNVIESNRERIKNRKCNRGVTNWNEERRKDNETR